MSKRGSVKCLDNLTTLKIMLCGIIQGGVKMLKKFVAGIVTLSMIITSVTSYAASMPSSGSTMIQPNKLTVKWDGGGRDPVTIDTFRFFGYNVAQLRTMVSVLGGTVIQLSDKTYQITVSGSQVDFTPIGFKNAGMTNYIINNTKIRDNSGALVTPSEPGWVYLTQYDYNWASIRDAAAALGIEISDVKDDPANGTTVVTVKRAQAAPAPTATPTPTAIPKLTATPTPSPVPATGTGSWSAPLAPGSGGSVNTYNLVTPAPQSRQTYKNLYTALQGETNAYAKYMAYADRAKADGYSAIANLFAVTADAEKLHGDNEWILLQNMGATDRPTAAPPTVGSTEQNLQDCISGESYEYTQMYPGFSTIATNEGLTDAARIFRRTGEAEQVHWTNYTDAYNNISNADYLSKYSVLYRCPVCGAIFATADMPAATCPVCGTAVNKFLKYAGGASQDSLTYANIYTALQGETNANVKYLAFAAQAKLEGYDAIANLFAATADAERLHGDEEWLLLQNMGATERPTAETPTVGSTADNLQACISGETYEYTTMYPNFAATATNEGFTEAAFVLDRTGKAEQVHNTNYTDALANLNNTAYLSKYLALYRCPACGAVYATVDIDNITTTCPVCETKITQYLKYIRPVNTASQSSATYANLYSALQGETNANAKYQAFADQAKLEGYDAVANMFAVTADAEKRHADAEWTLLQNMGATERSTPQALEIVVGSTVENLQNCIAGETYEYTSMYPDFTATATSEGYTDAARILKRTGEAEQVHAKNYEDALANLSNADYLSKYLILYRCPICGGVFAVIDITTSGATACPVCNAPVDNFLLYNKQVNSKTKTYANLYTALQGETNANAKYLAFAAKAKEEGYAAIAALFAATADAEKIHADNEWILLKNMGATVRPTADPQNVGTTAQNLQSCIDGETYESTTMYPDFKAAATAEGFNDAAKILGRTGEAEQIHGNNYKDALANLNNAGYLSRYLDLYRCQVCGSIFAAVNLPDSKCPVCGVSNNTYIHYKR